VRGGAHPNGRRLDSKRKEKTWEGLSKQYSLFLFVRFLGITSNGEKGARLEKRKEWKDRNNGLNINEGGRTVQRRERQKTKVID